MKIFRKKRLFVYIIFIAVTACIIVAVIAVKLNTNILIGKWITDDNKRIYIFDKNTLTVSSVVNNYSELYGYYLKNNSTLILQNDNEILYYTIKIRGSDIIISSADSDSSEVLHRSFV